MPMWYLKSKLRGGWELEVSRESHKQPQLDVLMLFEVVNSQMVVMNCVFPQSLNAIKNYSGPH